MGSCCCNCTSTLYSWQCRDWVSKFILGGWRGVKEYPTSNFFCGGFGFKEGDFDKLQVISYIRTGFPNRHGKFLYMILELAGWLRKVQESYIPLPNGNAGNKYCFFPNLIFYYGVSEMAVFAWKKS